MKALTFRDKEKTRYERIKEKIFSREAQQKGFYKRIPRSFCLSDNYSHENLYQGIRDAAITYFIIRGIPWHDGLKGRHLPSNHLCCSQSCCVNFLFPLVRQPALLKAIFSHSYPEMSTALPITADKPLSDASHPYISFEWIGTRDYLGEAKRKGMSRTRGANFTSADFTFRFRGNDGRVYLVLGEWKYTEEYGRNYKGSGRSGEVRRNNYINFFKDRKGAFSTNSNKDKLYDSLFYEPFYQLMRLQLLAQEMEAHKDKEMDADVVSVLHVCPQANNEFRKNVAPDYLKEKFPGKDVLEIWKELVPCFKFTSITVEDLLDTIVEQAGADNKEWVDYLRIRYNWNKLE